MLLFDIILTYIIYLGEITKAGSPESWKSKQII